MLINRYSAIIIIFLCLACGNHRDEAATDESAYSEDSAMAHFMEQPERAMVLLDSAVIVHNLYPQRAEYLKAIVAYNGMDKTDSCISICQRLIDEKAWEALPDSDDAVSFQVDLYKLMCTANTSSGNKPAVIRNARIGVKLAHGIKELQGDEADMLSRMGFVMCQTGQTEKGLDAMYQAQHLCAEDNSWSALLSYLNNSKKLFHSLKNADRNNSARNVVTMALSRLDKVVANPRSINHIPEAMINDNTALMEFVCYYRVPFYCYLINLCCKQGNIEEAEEWLVKYHEMADTTTWEGSQSIVSPLINMGRYAEARRLIRLAKASGDVNTVSFERLELLKDELLLAQMTGDHNAAKSIVDTIFTINDSLNTQSYRQVLADAAIQYHLQDEQIKRKDAEMRSNYIMISVAVVVLLIVIALFMYRYIKKQNMLKKKLSEEVEEAQMQIESLKEKNTLFYEKKKKEEESNLQELYRRAEYIMKQYKPFTDASFDINMLAQQIFSNRTYTSAAINQFAGINFRTWTGRYRVEHAKRILESQPKIKMDELASKCGFDSRINLYRQFKNIEGMSPLEWLNNREQIEENNKTNNEYEK